MLTDSDTVFLSYGREDLVYAERLYYDLRAYGLQVWWDQRSLLPGQEWDFEIKRAITDCRWFVALLSTRSVTKKGVVQREMRKAFEVLDLLPEGSSYLVPVRLESCVPTFERLLSRQWVDLFPEWERGLSTLLRTLGLDTDRIASANERFYEAMAILEHALIAPFQGVASSANLLASRFLEQHPGDRVALGLRDQIDSDAEEIRLLLANRHLLRARSQRLRFSTVSPSMVVQRAIKRYSCTARAKSLHIVFRPSRSEASLHADPDALETALANLLSNAVRFAARGTRITVRLEPAKDVCRIHVANEGMAFSSRVRDHLLSNQALPGVELASWTLDARGFGLEVARHILSLHGGTLAIRSEAQSKASATQSDGRFAVTVTLLLPWEGLDARERGAREALGVSIEGH